MKRPQYPILATTLGSVLGLACSNVAASGFRVPEISITGLGMSNAVVANSTEAGALAYNPAHMAFNEAKTLVAGVVYIKTDLKVDPQVGNPTKNQGEDKFYVPNLFYMDHINDKWSAGLAFNVPFGLETSWKAETFQSFAGPLAPLAPQKSKLEMFNVNPNVSYKLNDYSSVAAGIMYYDIRDLVFNTQGIKTDGDGDGWGYSLAFQLNVDDISIGASYRSRVNTDINGTVDGSPIGAGKDNNAEARLDFPSMLQVGIRYQATEEFALEFDFENTSWSSFGELEVRHNAAGVPPITSVNNWNNSNAYRLGASYDVTGNTQLRLGLALDRTPQPDAWFSARIPDDDRTLYSIGIAHTISNWTIEAGYMYVDWDNRNFTAFKTFGVDTPNINGSNLYNGEYDSSANLFGLGVTAHF